MTQPVEKLDDYNEIQYEVTHQTSDMEYIQRLPIENRFWSIIRLHFTTCSLLYDGFIFPTPASGNLSLAGLGGEISTWQYTGYNGYHTLEPEHWPDQEHNYFLWCGRLPGIVPYMGSRDGASIAVRTLPTNEGVDGILSLIGGEHFLFIMFTVTQRMIEFLPFDSEYIFVSNMELDHLMTLKKYTRMDFLFMRSFEDSVWMGIFMSWILVSLLISFIWSVFDRLHRRSSSDLWTDVWGHYGSVTAQLGSLLTGEPPELEGIIHDRRILGATSMRIVLGLWLLVTTTLAACQSGSMRDLMSAAAQLTVPRKITDLCDDTRFESYSIFATEVVDIESDVVNAECVNRIMNETRHVRYEIFGCFTEGFSCIPDILSILIEKRDFLAVMIGERDLFIALLLCDLWKEKLIEALTWEWMDFLQHKIYSKAHLELDEGGRQVSGYIAVSRGAAGSPEWLRHMDRTVAAFRENGVWDQILTVGDALIKNRLWRPEATEDEMSCQKLTPSDLNGAAILYGSMVGLTVVMFIIQLAYQRHQRGYTTVQPAVIVTISSEPEVIQELENNNKDQNIVYTRRSSAQRREHRNSMPRIES